MTVAAAPAPRPERRWVAPALWTALAIALSAPVIVLVGAVGTKLGLWGWQVGFLRMTVGVAPIAAIAGLIAGIAAVAVMLAFARRRWPITVVALLVPLATLGAFASVRAKAEAAPPIHDYATRWEPPLMPSEALLAARGPQANPIVLEPRMNLGEGRPEVENWADGRVSRIGSQACPDARSVSLAEAPAAAQARVKAALSGAGLAIAGERPGAVEATARTFWYGFTDDVMAEITPASGGSRVDFRSVSRVGVSDLGANCARLTKLTAALR